MVDSQQDCKHFRFRSRRLEAEAEAGSERLEWSWTRAASTCDKAEAESCPRTKTSKICRYWLRT